MLWNRSCTSPKKIDGYGSHSAVCDDAGLRTQAFDSSWAVALTPSPISGRPVLEKYGRYGSTISRIVCESGLQSILRFVGHVDEVFSWLERADIFLQPSRDHAYPHAIMEEMLLGKSCKSFPVGIALEGYAVGAVGEAPEISEKALAQKMLKLIKSQEMLTELGCRARQLMESRFEIRKKVEEYWDQLSSIRGQ